MTTPFILMTLACAIMAITICLQWRHIKRQRELNETEVRELIRNNNISGSEAGNTNDLVAELKCDNLQLKAELRALQKKCDDLERKKL